MEDTVIEQPVVETPVEVEQPVAALPAEPVLEEKTHVYQPTDDMGRPMGGKQVIKYRTSDELVQKIQDQNVLLIRKLRDETRKVKLGLPDEDDTVPETAKRRTEPRQFKPRSLTAEERVKLSRDLLDPDTMEEAADLLLEARFGAKPAEIQAELMDNQDKAIRDAANKAAVSFMQATPEYVFCADNAVAITNWITKKKLDPTDQSNYHLAFQTLKNAGIMVVKEEEYKAPEPVLPVVEQPITPAAPVEPEVPGVGSGFTREESSNAGTPRTAGSDIVYEVKINGQIQKFVGQAAIDAMPSDEYKRRINREPGFATKVDKLEKDAEARRRR